MKEKVDPYMQPLYDALNDFLPSKQVEKLMQEKRIEIAPLAFMRGRTLSNAFIVLDEAQNATTMQMKMFLTRLGEGSRMVITGDRTQVDLPRGTASGLADAERILKGVKGRDLQLLHLKGRRAPPAGRADHRGLTRPTKRKPEPLSNRAVGRAFQFARLVAWRYGRGMDLVETVIEDTRWEAFGLHTLSERAATAALAGLGLPQSGLQISLMGCDDARIATLNADFRGKPTPTNVLSWPSEDRAAEFVGEAPEPPVPGDAEDPESLGDIAIAFETCAREAEEQGKPMADHVTHLIVHGTLHLLGYDHVDDEDAELMEGLEVQILASLGVSDPY
jgi:probable rRNA maturation factor